MTRRINDYKSVEGLLFAHAITMSARGAAHELSVVVEKVELNPTLDQARFRMPETGPRP